MNKYKQFVKVFSKIEDSILILFTSALIIIAIVQFVLSMCKHGILWFDALIKYLVLWTGMIAANVATTNNKHIKIDIIGHWTKGRAKTSVNLAINLFSAIICVTLCVLSIIYLIEIELTSTDPSPFLNIPPWVLVLIIPITFGIMGIKFLLKTINCIYYLIKNVEYPFDENQELSKKVNTNDTNLAQ